MTANELCQRLESARWRFAKTMPEIPHWYTLRKDWIDAEFTEVASMIQRLGKPERFFNRIYTYFIHQGYKYWITHDPAEADLINRAEC